MSTKSDDNGSAISLCCDSHLKMDARFPWRQFRDLNCLVEFAMYQIYTKQEKREVNITNAQIIVYVLRSRAGASLWAYQSWMSEDALSLRMHVLKAMHIHQRPLHCKEQHRCTFTNMRVLHGSDLHRLEVVTAFQRFNPYWILICDVGQIIRRPI